ncbi:hypothetical protein GCM10020254_74020 [Streptomyces goshikiensis]
MTGPVPSSAAAPASPPVPAPLARLDAHLHALTAFYLELHRDPELSGAERRTADRFAARLESAGFAVTRGIGGHGLAGVLRNGDGPTVLLRAELDALPVRETSGLPYAADGEAAHACGHDLHLAAAAGTAALLAETPGSPGAARSWWWGSRPRRRWRGPGRCWPTASTAGAAGRTRSWPSTRRRCRPGWSPTGTGP